MKHFALFLLLPALLSGAESWPQWRGPEADGHAGKGGYPSVWNKTKNVAWKSALPGLSLIHISEPTRLRCISYAVFCLKKKNSMPT